MNMDFINRINAATTPKNVFNFIVVGQFPIILLLALFTSGNFLWFLFYTPFTTLGAAALSLGMKLTFKETSLEKDDTQINSDKKPRDWILSTLFYSPLILWTFSILTDTGASQQTGTIYFGNFSLEIYQPIIALFIIYILAAVVSFISSKANNREFVSGVEVLNIKILDFLLFTLTIGVILISIVEFITQVTRFR